jgi:hypothetical protein
METEVNTRFYKGQSETMIRCSLQDQQVAWKCSERLANELAMADAASLSGTAYAVMGMLVSQMVQLKEMEKEDIIQAILYDMNSMMKAEKLDQYLRVLKQDD